MTHSIEIVAQDYELYLRLVCHAVAGAPCRRRPPADDIRETWDADDPGLVDGECWATEWIEAAGWEDSVIAASTRGQRVVWGSLPVEVYYEEGVAITPTNKPPALVPTSPISETGEQ